MGGGGGDGGDDEGSSDDGTEGEGECDNDGSCYLCLVLHHLRAKEQ